MCGLLRMDAHIHYGGERGIRTPEAGFSRLHTFQACSFNHSDTSPLEPVAPPSWPRSGPAILPAHATMGHVLSRACPQVAPPALLRTGRPGTRGHGPHQRPVDRLGPLRLPVHGYARDLQD